MKRKFIFCCVFSLATLLSASNPQNDPVELRLNLKAGDSYLFRSEMEMKIDQTIMGQQMSISQSLTFEDLYEVLDSGRGTGDCPFLEVPVLGSVRAIRSRNHTLQLVYSSSSRAG